MKLQLLEEIAKEVKTCTTCVLHAGRNNTVFARGNPDSPICFIGEAPGRDEDIQGKPFVGRAGKLLDNMIRAMKLDPEDVYICNICKCRPPNNRKPELAEMDACKPFLVRQLDVVRHKVIVALGATATEGLLGPGIGITK
jgi:uracil-DNA glycosylase